MAFKYLSLEDILRIHEDQLLNNGGGLPGVKDSALLDSALASPEQAVFGKEVHETLFDKAGAYLFHIAKDHAFHDGNKRTGAVAARQFMLINGMRLEPNEDEFESLTRAAVEGQVNEEEVSEFIKRNSSIDRGSPPG